MPARRSQKSMLCVLRLTRRLAASDATHRRSKSRHGLIVAANGQAARDAVRPSVARYLGAPVHLRTLVSQGLALPTEAVAQVAGAPYSAGTKPYMPLIPLITDRHVDALTLAGTIDEVVAHAVSLRDAGVDAIIARPTAPNADMIDETILKLGAEVWPRVEAATRNP